MPFGITGDVYEKFEPGEPGLFMNAPRQLAVVLVNVPARAHVLAERVDDRHLDLLPSAGRPRNGRW